MPSVEEARQNVRDWMLAIFPTLKTQWSNSNKGQPDEPYFTVKLIHTKWYPHARLEILNDDDEAVIGYGKLFYSIQAIGGKDGTTNDPQMLLQRLANSFETTKSEIYFTQKEMGYCGLTANINEISSVVGQAWESRAAMTVMFDARIPDNFVTEFARLAEIEIIADNGTNEHREVVEVDGILDNECQ